MIRKLALHFSVIMAVIATGCCSQKKLTPGDEAFRQRQQMDMGMVIVYRDGLESIMKYVESRDDIFPDKKKKSVLPVEARDELRILWRSICDYYLALDSIYLEHEGYSDMSEPLRADSFNICRASLLATYRFALDFIEIAERAPDIDIMLNEPLPDVGLPKGTYSSFKTRYLNIKIATEFAAFEVVSQLYGKPGNRELLKRITADSKAIWKAGKWKGELMALKNGIDILKNETKERWFPVQKGISNWAGDTRVYRQEKNLITAEQVIEITKELRPGDIILERREWYLTNMGIPGFWTHAALYIGTPQERADYFKGPDAQRLLDEEGATTFEDILMKDSKAYKLSTTADSHGIYPRVCEAIGEGVLFTTIEHSADCDSIVVLRPGLSKYEVGRAIIRAYGYSGRPYDFDFDFRTDSSIVCSELVYKAYEPSSGMKGIKFVMENVMGRKMVTPNGMAKMYSDEYSRGESQMQFVLFYDGQEKKGVSVRSTEKKFRKSCSRPKWHIFTGK